MADSDENNDYFSRSRNYSYRDSNENFDQTVFPPSDLNEPCSNVSSSETKLHEDGDLNVSFSIAYYATKYPAAKWRKYPSSGAGRPKLRDILQESGPSNYVSTSIASPKDAFNLTFPFELVHKVLKFSNQLYQRFCPKYQQSSAANRFHGYQSFN